MAGGKKVKNNFLFLFQIITKKGKNKVSLKERRRKQLFKQSSGKAASSTMQQHPINRHLNAIRLSPYFIEANLNLSIIIGELYTVNW